MEHSDEREEKVIRRSDADKRIKQRDGRNNMPSIRGLDVGEVRPTEKKDGGRPRRGRNRQTDDRES